MTPVSRRAVLAGGSAGSLLLAGGLAQATPAFQFSHGVASGDPRADSVLLWTRALSTDAGPVSGTWQVATDKDFRHIKSEGKFRTTAERDHIVKVIATGLHAGTDYWYRFNSLGSTSPVGRTKTLATGSLEKLDIALACCAMYMLGEFHAYQAIAERISLDLVLFIGDYIYEYGANSFPTSPDIRVPQPTHGTVTLADYRTRYAFWRTDPALQAAHARAPWICMWDDHEIANDDWMGGAQHHDPKTQGTWEARKAVAVQAYKEWMPIRDPEVGDPYAVQRSFAFGDLATLVLPETRLEARSQQLTIPHDLDMHVVDHADPAHPRIVSDAALLAGLDRRALPARYRLEPDIAGFRAKLADPERHMIGAAQLAWIEQETKASVEAKKPWLLFGSPTIMAHYVWPDLNALVPSTAKARFEALQPGGSALYRMTGLDLPLFNLDSWDGYPAERDRVFDIFAESKADVLVLSGDSHMAWINDLHHHGKRVALEVSATTLSGPSIGDLLQLQEAPVGETFARENADVQWCDHLATGFISVTITRTRATANFISVLHPRRTNPETRVVKGVGANRTPSGLTGWKDL